MNATRTQKSMLVPAAALRPLGDNPSAKDLDLIGEAELARMLDVSEYTLQSWRREGYGPDFAKLGKTIWYRREDVLEWIGFNVRVQTRRLPPGD